MNTGTDDAANSRALILFNLSSGPLSGAVRFRVDMPWRSGKTLQPICVTHMHTGIICPSAVRDHRTIHSDSESGRIFFALWFAVSKIAARSWDTYIAEYCDEDFSPLPLAPVAVAPFEAYKISETLRHSGILPPYGRIPNEN